MKIDMENYILTKEEYKKNIESLGGYSEYTLKYEQYRRCAIKAIVRNV